MQFLMIVLVGVVTVASASHLGGYGYRDASIVVEGGRSSISGPSGTIHTDTNNGRSTIAGASGTIHRDTGVPEHSESARAARLLNNAFLSRAGSLYYNDYNNGQYGYILEGLEA